MKIFIARFVVVCIFMALIVTNSRSDVLAQDPLVQRISGDQGLTNTSYYTTDAISISADGNLVLFGSDKEVLPGDTLGSWDLFLYDRTTGQIELVTKTPNGDFPNGDSAMGYLSPNGRYISYPSRASDIVDSDITPDGSDFFVYDRLTGVTTMESLRDDGSQYPTNLAGANVFVSNDGKYTIFSGNTGFEYDPWIAPYAQVYVRDRTTGSITCITKNDGGNYGSRDSWVHGISDDGTKIIFSSGSHNLIINGDYQTSLYLYDMNNPGITLISRALDGGSNDAGNIQASINTDGTYIAFSTNATNILEPVENVTHDVYLYDLATTNITRIPQGIGGIPPDAGSVNPSFGASNNYVLYESYASNLVPNDTNAHRDVFKYDLQSGTTELITLGHDGQQKPELSVNRSFDLLPRVSADGRYVAYQTSAEMVADDDNNAIDVFLYDRDGVVGDASLPNPITDLEAVTGSSSGTVELSWTAPGDDGTMGTATSYIVRYWDNPIGTELGWATAIDVDGEPTPQAAGNTETMTISGLTPGQTYYFMVRAEDEVGNRSDLGNSPSAMAGEGGKVIDLTISLYKSTDTATARTPYERILEFFADSVYEMSNGVHKIGTVTIYQNGEAANTADVKWVAEEWPMAYPSGYGRTDSEMQVFFGDVFPFPTPVNALLESNWRRAGYTLGHEWGHYYYGLFDEYVANIDDGIYYYPHSDDKAVTNSIMNDQVNAINGDFNWLNFSISKNNTKKTAQHRMYKASGWETLVRPLSEDPRTEEIQAVFERYYYPELSGVAPIEGQNPSLELPNAQSQARSELNIQWINSRSNLMDASNAFYAKVGSITGNQIEYPQPVVLVASVWQDYLIAQTGITASVVPPSGSPFGLTFRDDGLAPDVLADDGLYSSLMPYNQGGVYTVSVSFDNDADTAKFTRYAFLPTSGPNGETPDLTLQPVGINFHHVATTPITIVNFSPDDHSDTAQTATNLQADNVDVPGRIDRSSDVDMFKVIPTETGRVIVRVSDLAFDMKPNIQILGADGQTVVDEFNFTSQNNGYFFTSVNAQANQAFYIAISHSDQDADTGLYDVSVGSPLTGSPESGSSIYLPMVLK